MKLTCISVLACAALLMGEVRAESISDEDWDSGDSPSGPSGADDYGAAAGSGVHQPPGGAKLPRAAAPSKQWATPSDTGAAAAERPTVTGEEFNEWDSNGREGLGHVEYGYESYGQRLSSKLGGAAVGWLIFALSFVVLFLNEGVFVSSLKKVAETDKKVIRNAPLKASAENDNKVIHLMGAECAVPLGAAVVSDETFKVSAPAPAFQLKREVQMYQWKEHSRTTKGPKEIGGGQHTKTEYFYEKGFYNKSISHASFKEKDGHKNPPKIKFANMTFDCDEITVNQGGYSLDPGLKDKVRRHGLEVVSSFKTKYGGARTEEEVDKIGMHWIQHKANKSPATWSIIALQKPGGVLAPHKLQYLSPGTKSLNEMMSEAKAAAQCLTWVLRLVGFLMMYFGLEMVMEPLGALVDFLPFLGSIMRLLTSGLSVLVAAILSVLTIAVAWLYYRPFHAVAVIGLCLALLYRHELTAALI